MLYLSSESTVKPNYKPCDIPGARISQVVGAPLVKLGVSTISSLPFIFINWFDAGSTTLNVIGELPVVGLVKDIIKPFLTGKP